MPAFRVAIEQRAPEAPYRPVMGSRRWLLVLEARDPQDAEGVALDHLRAGGACPFCGSDELQVADGQGVC